MSESQARGRITFQPTVTADDAITALMARTGMSKTGVLNRAVSLYELMSRLGGDSGEGITVSSPKLEDPLTLVFF